MDIIQQERENIIRENNTAQEIIEAIIANMKPTITELTIQNPLFGNLDLSVLEKFSQLHTLVFHSGKITELRNIPIGISRLECSGNLLTELDNLSGSLLVLNISDNFLKTVNLMGASHLEELYCNNNRIVEFVRLPPSLVKLYCDQNELRKLDLKGLINLRILHCSQNPILRIENLPEDIHEFEAENSPFAMEVEMVGSDSDDDDETPKKSPKEIDRKIEYLDALQIYFKTKAKYEENLRTKQRKAFKNAPTKKLGRIALRAVKTPCIYCKRPVGTRFWTDATGYFAMCGDSQEPCKLNIKLIRGKYEPTAELLYWFKENVDSHKEKIIKNKLDSLFHYYSDETSVKMFKDILEKYKEDSMIYSEYLKIHEETYKNPHKEELMAKKIEKINQIRDETNAMIRAYEVSENPEPLRTAMEIYVHDYTPEIENLRRLKYEMVEMEDNVLHQWSVGLQKMETNFLDKPEVIHFVGL